MINYKQGLQEKQKQKNKSPKAIISGLEDKYSQFKKHKMRLQFRSNSILLYLAGFYKNEDSKKYWCPG